MKKLILTLLCSCAFVAAAYPQSDIPTAERAMDILRRHSSVPRAPYAGTGQPAADGEHYRQTVRGGGILLRSYADEAVCDTLLPAGTAGALTGYEFAADGRILLSDGATPIYRHSFTTDYRLWNGCEVTDVAPEIGGKRDASFSPDGRRIAFASGNDLYLYNVEDKSVVRVTSDGRWNEVINGTTDWVYEEEFGFTRAYAFSPDGRQLAYLRFDESRVPMFSMMRYDGRLYNRAYDFKYPKAGDTNSTVTLHVYDTESGTTRRIDTGAESDQYIPHIG